MTRVATTQMSYDDATRAGAIKPGVRPLVEVLNIRGTPTIASCERHGVPRRFLFPGTMELSPFVMFRHGGQDNELHYVWSLEDHFYPPEWTEMVWVIKLTDVRTPDQRNRRRVDTDFAALAAMIAFIRDKWE